MALPSLKRTMKWAWTRDEVNGSATKQSVLDTTTLYVVGFLALLSLALALWLLGSEAAAVTVAVFGLAYTVYVGTIAIGWEVVRYLVNGNDSGPAKRRRIYDPYGTAVPSPPSVVHRSIRSKSLPVSKETKIGFLVTIMALLIVIGFHQLAIWL